MTTSADSRKVPPADRLAATLRLALKQANELHAQQQLSATAGIREYIEFADRLLTAVRQNLPKAGR